MTAPLKGHMGQVIHAAARHLRDGKLWREYDISAVGEGTWIAVAEPLGLVCSL